jgi:hypothetical protein
MGVIGLGGMRIAQRALAAIACLAITLDVYTVHFVLIPYYTGQIVRTATGRLENFVALRFLDFDVVREMVRRLAVNESAVIGPGMIMIAWAVYAVATGWLLVTAARMILGWQYEQRPGTPPAVHPLDKS